MTMLGKIVVVLAAVSGGVGCYAEPADSSWDYAGAYDPDPTYAGSTNVEPPAEYVATTQPVYFSGHGTYFYGQGWRYRSRGQWNTYRTEPRTLYELRMNGHASAPSHRRYEGPRKFSAHHGGSAIGRRR